MPIDLKIRLKVLEIGYKLTKSSSVHAFSIGEKFISFGHCKCATGLSIFGRHT
jgi:hypothetical protein